MPDYIDAHAFSSNHRSQILKDKKCGCFYCLEIFEFSDITDWIDLGDTAICPYCGIDSVIGESSGFPIAKEFLEKMRHYWF